MTAFSTLIIVAVISERNHRFELEAIVVSNDKEPLFRILLGDGLVSHWVVGLLGLMIYFGIHFP